ncbi:hypothetical protein BC941DRAFT_475495 [Chlamydoabsidia padenii]|nr:hypothetical protein BC941DRAFT_475495 [Chlamydoabsidia padenii]
MNQSILHTPITRLPLPSHANPLTTITFTFYKTSTLPPVFATRSFSSFSTPSFLTIPYTETTITTIQQTTIITTTPPHLTDEARLFPALIVFALFGLLAIITLLALCLFCLHRQCRKQSHDVAMPESTFVPIESSPLTLVPRAAIWQDPMRRRGVNELDLWERKQQHHEEEPPSLSFLPPPPPEEEEEEEAHEPDDRPWQRYMHHRSPQPLSDLAHAITLAAMDEEKSMTSRSSLPPRQHSDTIINQSGGGLENSGTSQWLYPPTSSFYFK